MLGKDGATPHLEGLWRELAPLCKVWSHDEIVLEIMNEPHEIEKPEFWHAAQRRVHKIIREACPQHTILATGDQWGGVDGLLALPALDDANVVYSFHFYDPMTFTHQGATWGWEGWKDLKDVEYPLACGRARELAKRFAGSQGAKGLIGEHCNGEEAVKHGGWNSQRIAARIDRAVAWAKTNARSGVPLPLYCGEFGVYRAFAPAPSRANWIRDVRLVLEERGIGWAMWDYVGGFALAKDGTRETDPAIAQALGMR
jgi:endoglucanase